MPECRLADYMLLAAAVLSSSLALISGASVVAVKNDAQSGAGGVWMASTGAPATCWRRSQEYRIRLDGHHHVQPSAAQHVLDAPIQVIDNPPGLA